MACVTASASMGAARARARVTRPASCAQRVLGCAHARARSAVEVGGGVERAQLVLPLRQQRGQFGRRAPVAARQADPGRQARVELGQALRVERRCGAGSRAACAPHPATAPARLAAPRSPAPGARRTRPPRCSASSGAAGQRGRRCSSASDSASSADARGVDQRLRVGQPLVLGVRARPIRRRRGELVDLADLPGQALALALELGALACARASQRCAAPPCQRDHSAASGAVSTPAYASSRARTAAGARQALPGVLAVDVDQLVGRLAQLARPWPGCR